MAVRSFGLSPEQIRVLGALAEKAATTPETYPLTSNALRTACNQRSSRDPVVDYDDDTVTAAMLALRERELAKTVRGSGSRVLKHAHALDRLDLDEAQIAVLAVLLLRGPQTVGELKTRCERQHAFDSLADVQSCLAALAERPEPLAVQLPREAGQKEARWRHLLDADPVSGALPGARSPDSSAEKARPASPPPRSGDRGLSEPLADEAAARERTLAEIARRLDALESGLDELRRRLGED